MLKEHERRLIEENMDNIKIVVRLMMDKYNIRKDEYDDYCQTGYLILCEKVSKYDESVKFSTFINAVLHNAFVDKYRMDKSRKIDALSLDEPICDDGDTVLADILASPGNTENDVLSKLTADMLNRCINNAKDKCNAHTTIKGFEALELRIKGYSGKEISDILNAPQNSVRAWISRAKNLLVKEKEFMALMNK